MLREQSVETEEFCTFSELPLALKAHFDGEDDYEQCLQAARSMPEDVLDDYVTGLRTDKLIRHEMLVARIASAFSIDHA